MFTPFWEDQAGTVSLDVMLQDGHDSSTAGWEEALFLWCSMGGPMGKMGIGNLTVKEETGEQLCYSPVQWLVFITTQVILKRLNIYWLLANRLKSHEGLNKTQLTSLQFEIAIVFHCNVIWKNYCFVSYHPLFANLHIVWYISSC